MKISAILIVFISFSCDAQKTEISIEKRALNYFIEMIYNSEPFTSEYLNSSNSRKEHFYDYGNGLRIIPDLPDYFTDTNVLEGFNFYSSGKIFETTTLPIHPDSITYNPDLYLEENTSPLGQIINEDEKRLKKQIEIDYPIRVIDSYEVFNNLNRSRSLYMYVYKALKKDDRSYVKISLISPREGLIYERYNFFIVFDAMRRVENWFITVSE